jgi:hypothetical protein
VLYSGSFFYRIYGYIFCILLIKSVGCVSLLLCLCILVVVYALFFVFCFHHANWHSPATLTEVFPCFLLSCKAHVRVYLTKTGHSPHSSWLVNCFVLYVVLCRLCCSMYCLCVNVYYCHQVSTQLQLNMSYHISYPIVYHQVSGAILPLAVYAFKVCAGISLQRKAVSSV